MPVSDAESWPRRAPALAAKLLTSLVSMMRSVSKWASPESCCARAASTQLHTVGCGCHIFAGVFSPCFSFSGRFNDRIPVQKPHVRWKWRTISMGYDQDCGKLFSIFTTAPFISTDSFLRPRVRFSVLFHVFSCV